MSKENLFRMSGGTAVLVGLVMVFFNSVTAIFELPQQLINYRTFLSPFLLIFAFTGLYAYQSHKAGLLGLAGYVLTVASLVLNICFRFSETFIGPVLVAEYPEAVTAIVAGPYSTVQSITFGLFLAGYVLFGIAALRARVLPRGGAYLLILGAILSFVLVMLPVNIGAILAGVALIWMGYAQYSSATLASTSFSRQLIAQQ
jgi:hypothetical protein